MLSWFAMFFSLSGVYLNAKKRRISWLVWMVANVSWAVVGYHVHDIPMMAVQVIYFFFGVYGWFQWKPQPSSVARLAYVKETTWGELPTGQIKPLNPKCNCDPSVMPYCDECRPFTAADHEQILNRKKVSVIRVETTDPDGFIAFLQSCSAEIKKWPQWKQDVAAKIAAGWQSDELAEPSPELRRKYLEGTFPVVKPSHHRTAKCGCKWNGNIHGDICPEHGTHADPRGTDGPNNSPPLPGEDTWGRISDPPATESGNFESGIA